MVEVLHKMMAEAGRWCRLSAAQGSAGGQYGSGFMFECGRGVAKDTADAIRRYRLAAAQGQANANAALSRFFA
jgi:TPR repeat protein